MNELVAIARTGPDLVTSLEKVWARGDAVLPVDPSLPAPARVALFSSLQPTRLIDPEGNETRLDGQPVDEGDALVVATSGSTGTPKGVIHTHRSLEVSAQITSAALGVDPSTDKWLCCLPLTHIAGLAIVMRSRVTNTPLVVLHRFDADAVTKAAQNGATLTSLVPTALARIDSSIFRRIIVGGSASPEFLPANCRASYGMTETGSAVVFDGDVLEGVELRIIDGEIQIRGDMLLRAYRDGTNPRTSDGWFSTNDGGEFDSAGKLIVHGRRGDMIITGGENVWPSPVEEIINLLASIHEVALVGRTDPEWGQVVTAIVVATDAAHPPTLDELREAVSQRLPVWNAPRQIEFVAALPRTSLGKVERKAL